MMAPFCCYDGSIPNIVEVDSFANLPNEMTVDHVPWDQIPDDMLSEISGRVTSTLQVQRLRAVCTRWRVGIPIRKELASNLCPLIAADGLTVQPDNRFILCALRLCCLRHENHPPSLIKIWKYHESDTWTIASGLGDAYSRVWPTYYPYNFTNPFCSLSVDLEELGMEYFVGSKEGPPLLERVAVMNVSHENFIVLAVDGGMLMRFQSGHAHWTRLEGFEGHTWMNVVSAGVMFYAVDTDGSLLRVSPDLSICELITREGLGSPGDQMFLCSDLDENILLLNIFWIHFPYGKCCTMELYRYSNSDAVWVKSEKLSGMLLILGRHSLISVSTASMFGETKDHLDNAVLFHCPCTDSVKLYELGTGILQDNVRGMVVWPPGKWLSQPG